MIKRPRMKPVHRSDILQPICSTRTKRFFGDRGIREFINFNHIQCEIRTGSTLLLVQERNSSRMKQLNGISVLLLLGVSASCEQLEHLRRQSFSPSSAIILTVLQLCGTSDVLHSSCHLRPIASAFEEFSLCLYCSWWIEGFERTKLWGDRSGVFVKFQKVLGSNSQLQ